MEHLGRPRDCGFAEVVESVGCAVASGNAAITRKMMGTGK